MDHYFEDFYIFQKDCYVADYSKQTACQKKVELSETPFNDINSFHLHNPNNITYWGINFERNEKFFTENGGKISQCECMLAAKRENETDKKSWICLVELKYCEEKNIRKKGTKAFDQLEETFTYLKGKGVIDMSKHRVYLNYSVPDFSNREPFTAFKYPPAEILKIKREKGYQILGLNNLSIFNKEFIVHQII